jgi:hypothetical protein
MRMPEALFEHLPGVIKNYVWPGEVYTVWTKCGTSCP